MTGLKDFENDAEAQEYETVYTLWDCYTFLVSQR